MTASPQPAKVVPASPGRGALLPSKLDPLQEAQAHVFQPPGASISTSPSPFTFDHHRAGSWDDPATPDVTWRRFRAALDTASTNYFDTPYSASANGWTTMSDASTILRSADAASPPPFVNTRYTCAGGLDTPTMAAAAVFDNEDDNPYTNFRRRWSITSNDDSIPAPQALSHGKRKLPLSSDDTSSDGWGKFVFSLVGGVAGKVWEFARTNAFSGFYAGGGKGYGLMNPNGVERKDSVGSVWEDVNNRPAAPLTFDFSSTPLPGRYPEDDFGEIAEDASPRPAKRQHTDMGSSWVMVPRADEDSKTSSARIAVRKAPQSSGIPRFSRPRTASGSRRSLLPVSRRSSSISHTNSPGPQAEKTTSYALPRSRPHSRQISDPSPGRYVTPLSPEAQQWMAQRRKEEKEADASMRKLNAQLKAMIKEGREALGTTVEIEDDMDDEMEDEGFAEGWPDQQMKW